jgi:hypothetical protein
MFTFLSIFLLQLAFTYKILFIPRTNRLYTQKKNEIIIDYNSSSHRFRNNTATNIQIQKFIENIKRREEQDDYLKEIWDDGEVEW